LKKTLHNRVNRSELKKSALESTLPRTTLSFYTYAHIHEPEAFRDRFYLALSQLDVFGRIYVAREGINAQISVPTSRRDELVDYFNTIPFLTHLRLNMAIEDDGKSFFTLAIKVKDRIVADGH
jgi:UPF0176 protein